VRVPLAAFVRQNTGERLGFCAGPALNKLGLVGRRNRGRFPLMYGVDPYSDTTFNGLQMEQLRAEIAAMRDETTDQDVRDIAAEVLALTDIVLAGVHRVLVFVGD
jgi:hypothetical protein